MLGIVMLLMAQGGVTLPPELKFPLGEAIVLRAETEGKIVRFVPLDAGLKELDPKLLASPKDVVYTTLRPGKYRVLAYSAVKDEPTAPFICTVIVEGETPAPIPPNPDIPSPIAEVLKPIYGALTEATKAEHVKKLAATYRSIAAGVKSEGDFATFLSGARSTFARNMPANAIVPIRERLSVELANQLPFPGTAPMDATLVSRVQATFLNIASALDQLTK